MSSDSGHRRAVVQPPLSQCIRISEFPDSERRVRSSFLSDVILNLLDSTINVPFLKRPKSVVQYTEYSLGGR